MRVRRAAEGRVGAGRTIWKARGTKFFPRWRQTRTPPEGAPLDRVVCVVGYDRKKVLSGAKGLRARRHCTGMQPWPLLHL